MEGQVAPSMTAQNRAPISLGIEVQLDFEQTLDVRAQEAGPHRRVSLEKLLVEPGNPGRRSPLRRDQRKIMLASGASRLSVARSWAPRFGRAPLGV